MAKKVLLAVWLLLITVAVALGQTRQPAQMSVTPTTNPVGLWVLDSNGSYILVGTFPPGGPFTAMGAAYLPLAGGTMTGRLNVYASFAGAAGFNLGEGFAPIAPIDGDLWATSAGIFAQINGVTIGPFTSGSAYLPLAGGTLTGELKVPASTTGTAGLNVGQGAAPTSPANGDLWVTSAGLFARIGGVTVGPYSDGTGSYLPLTGGTLTGKLNAAPATSGAAGINLGAGTSPSSPVNGDVWATSAGVFAQIAGSPVGPFSAGGSGGGTVAGGLQYEIASYPTTGTTVGGAGPSSPLSAPGPLFGTWNYGANGILPTLIAPYTPSGNVIHMLANWVPAGWTIADTTTSGVVLPGTFVTSNVYDALTLSNPVQGIGIQNGDTLTVAPPTGSGLGCIQNNGAVGSNNGWVFDKYNCAQYYASTLTYNGSIQSWIMGPKSLSAILFYPYPSSTYFILANGDDSSLYVPQGGGMADFSAGLTLNNNTGSGIIGSEEWVDAGTGAPPSAGYSVVAQSSFTLGVTTSFNVSNFCLGFGPGDYVIDESLATGVSVASIIGQIQTCNTSTGLLTFTTAVTQTSATPNDTLLVAVQATGQWNGYPNLLVGNVVIPVNTCNGTKVDFGWNLQDLSLPNAPLVGNISTTPCANQIILTGQPTQRSIGSQDFLAFGPQAIGSWTTSATGLPLAGSDALATPDVLMDASLSGVPEIGVFTSITPNILATTTAVGHASAGVADNILYAEQATASFPAYTSGQSQISVTNCNSANFPANANITDLSLVVGGVPQVIGTIFACLNPAVLYVNSPPGLTSASHGAADNLVFGLRAFAPWTTSSAVIGFSYNDPNGCTDVPGGTTIGKVAINMSLSPPQAIGKVASCAVIISGDPLPQITLTGNASVGGSALDNIVFANPATAAFLSTDNTIPMGSCNEAAAGQIVVDASISGLPVLAPVSGCGVFANIASPAAHASSGPNDNVIAATPASNSWVQGQASIQVASCARLIAGKWAVDATLSGQPIIGDILACAPGSPNLLTFVTGEILTTSGLVGGTGFQNGSYFNIPLTTNGLGSGAAGNFTIAGGIVTAFSIATSRGASYSIGDSLGVDPSQFGGTGSGFGAVVASTSTGAAFASNGVADNLIAITQSKYLAASAIPNPNFFAWTNVQSNIEVPFCDGATPSLSVIDFSISGYPNIGPIGVCGPTIILQGNAQTPSAATLGVPGATFDILLATQRRVGDIRNNQNAKRGGFGGWITTDAGALSVPFGPISNSPAIPDYTASVLRSGPANTDFTGRLQLSSGGSVAFTLLGKYLTTPPNCGCWDTDHPANQCVATEGLTSVTFSGLGPDHFKWICGGGS